MKGYPAYQTPSNTVQNAHVLIVEDEKEIFEILNGYLERSGFRCTHARDGVEGLAMHDRLRPDLVLLDIQMPREDGWAVLSRIRLAHATPVIMLTARDSDMDKLMGLRLGADDYVVKPFNPAEIVARVEAVLRRATAGGQAGRDPSFRAGALYIDMESYEIRVERNGAPQTLPLTLTEFKLLAHLARWPKRVFSREELMQSCLPESDKLERTVDSHLSKLRKKLEAVDIFDVPFCVRGIGYRLGNAQ